MRNAAAQLLARWHGPPQAGPDVPENTRPTQIASQAAWGSGPQAFRAYFLPQHRSVPTLTLWLSTPATALSAIRVTPVST